MKINAIILILVVTLAAVHSTDAALTRLADAQQPNLEEPPAVSPPPNAAEPPPGTPLPTGFQPPPPGYAPPSVPPDYPPPQYVQPAAPVVLDQSPQFLYSAPLGAYVAVGVPYDIVYVGGFYYYWRRGYWYRGPYYNGPWVYATRAYLPPALLSYRIREIRQFRKAEFQEWKRLNRRYRGRVHRPAYRR